MGSLSLGRPVGYLMVLLPFEVHLHTIPTTDPKTLLNRLKMKHCYLGNASALMMFQCCSPQSQWIKDLLEKTPPSRKEPVISVRDIVLLLEFCPQINFFSRPVQWTGQECGYGFPSKPHCCLICIWSTLSKRL